MNEDEAKRAIRRCGWTCSIRKKASGRYLRAYKRINGHLYSVYICALSRLPRLQPQDVQWKLRNKENITLAWLDLRRWQILDNDEDEDSNQSA